MQKSQSRRREPPKRVLALPDLEHAKTAVLDSLTSASGQLGLVQCQIGIAWLNESTRRHCPARCRVASSR
jgi:hypothetical protein